MAIALIVEEWNITGTSSSSQTDAPASGHAEKAAGFEAVPGMTILPAVYAAGRKKR